MQQMPGRGAYLDRLLEEKMPLNTDTSASSFCSSYFLTIIPISALVCQLAPLAIGRPFYSDWVNHAWIIEYMRQDLWRGNLFTAFIDARDAAGNPLPLFYGYLFYPLMSIVSAVLGTDIALRFAAAALLVGNIIAYTAYLTRYTRSLPIAMTISVAVLTSVYELTNLYSRSALPEFFAHQFLILSFPFFAYSIAETGLRSLKNLSLGLALLSGVLGTHPITFYLFALFVAPVLLPLTAVGRHRDLWIGQAILALLFAFVTSSWLVLLWGSGPLEISRDYFGVRYFTDSIDGYLHKLAPFMLDVRVLESGIATSTPFLEAPLNLAGALLVVTLLARRWDLLRVIWFAIALVEIVLVAILSVPVGQMAFKYEALSHLLAPIQFVYRLTGTFSQQICALLVFGLCCKAPQLGPWSGKRALVLVVSVTIACTSVFAKAVDVFTVFHSFPAYLMQSPSGAAESAKGPDSKGIFSWSYRDYLTVIKRYDRYPMTFYGKTDYSMREVLPPKGTPQNDAIEIQISFAAAKDRSASVDCERACVVRTDLLPSNLFVLLSDESLISAGSVFEEPAKKISVNLPAGRHHLRYRPAPMVYIIQATRYVWLAWLALSIASFFWPARGVRITWPQFASKRTKAHASRP